MKKRLLILLGVIVFIVLAIQAYKALTKEPVGEQYPPGHRSDTAHGCRKI